MFRTLQRKALGFNCNFIASVLQLETLQDLSNLRSTTLVRSRYNNIVFLYRELGHVISGL